MNNAKRLAALEEQTRPPASVCDALALLLTVGPWTDADRALVTECAKTSEVVRALLASDNSQRRLKRS